MNTARKTALILLSLLILSLPGRTQEPELTQQIADRYEQLLVRSPEAGTAFDRVTQWYATGGGGLEVLEDRWATAAESDPQNKVSYLLLQGLLSERQRDPDTARTFYEQALEASSDPARPARMLAELEAFEGNLNAAAAAYETALEAEVLNPVDKIDLLRDLALVYQRGFEQEKALEVWQRAIEEFGQDEFVLEEAGEAFLDSGNYDRARAAFEKLSELARTDPFKRIAATLRQARTEELAGNDERAIEIYDAALAETSEGSWQNREIRSRIEELFRRKDNLPGLLEYYAERIDSNPRDFEAFAAKSVVEYDLGRVDESLASLRNAIELAPGEADYRITLARRQSELGRMDEAIETAKALTRQESAPTSALLLLGDLQWRKSRDADSDAARQAAIETWNKIAPEGSDDASAIAQLAEILASHELIDLAIEQWERLIEVAPPAADARQRLAGVYLERGEEATAQEILRGMVAENPEAEDYLLLSRVYGRLDIPDDALRSAEEGLEVFPQNYDLLNHTWKLLQEVEDYDAAIALFPRIWSEAPNSYFAEDSVTRFLILLDAAEKTSETVESLTAKLEGDSPLEEQEIAVLFELAIQQRKQELASQILEETRTDRPTLSFLQMQSKFAERFEGSEEQIDALQRIAEKEPRLATDSLRKVADIQANSGEAEGALETVQNLINRAPGDPEFYRLYSDIAERVGKTSQAVDVLEKGLRFVDEKNPLRLRLADLLTQMGRTDQAYEMLSEAFEQSEDESGRMDMFRRMAEMAMFTNSLDRLIASLEEKQTKEVGGARYGRYLAEIYLSQGDYGRAREELMKSLGTNPDDPVAVQRLMRLAEREGNHEEVTRLSERLAELEPSGQNLADLTRTYFEGGQLDEAVELLRKNREELQKDPAVWMEALMAAHNAGATETFREAVDALAARPQSTPSDRLALAMLLIGSGENDHATAILRQTVDTPEFAKALEAATDVPPQISPRFVPNAHQQAFLSMQSLSRYAGSIMQQLQRMYQPHSRSYRSFGFGFSGALGVASLGTGPTPDQEALIKAFFTLAHIAWASGDAEQKAALTEIVNRQPIPTNDRFVLLGAIGAQEEFLEAMKEYLEGEQEDPEVDRFLLSSLMSIPPTVDISKEREQLEERISRLDPAFAFDLLTTEAASKVRTEPDAEVNWTERLLNHPGRDPEEALDSQKIAGVALLEGRLDQAGELFEEALSRMEEEAAATGAPGPIRGAQWSFANQLAAAHLENGDYDQTRRWLARAMEFYVEQTSGSGGLPNPMVMSGSRIRQNYQFLNPISELQIGFSYQPWPVFQSFVAAARQKTSAEQLTTFFDEALGTSEEDAALRFYNTWRQGDREKAVSSLAESENLQEEDYAVLLEAYEALGKSKEALAVIDQAPVGQGETKQSRALRKVRLLRDVGETEQARKEVERLVNLRLDTQLRGTLSQEMNQLGMNASQYPQVVRTSPQRVSRADRLRNRIQKLASEEKYEEVDQLARQVLLRPIPDLNDHQQRNLRSNVVNTLGNAKRLGEIEKDLRSRMEENPEDHEAAVILAEVLRNQDREEAADILRETIRKAPPDPRLIAYASELLRQVGQQKEALELFVELARKDPDHPYFSRMNLQQAMNLGSNSNASILLAELLVEMSPEDLRRFLLPTRLSGQGDLSSTFSGLAELSVREGEKEDAIKLLTLANEEPNMNQTTRLNSMVRLAELQQETGDEEGVRETLSDMFEGNMKGGSRPGYGLFQHRAASLDAIIFNALANNHSGHRGQGAPEERIRSLIELASDAGMTDALLATLEAPDDSFSPFGVSSRIMDASLLVRTMMQRQEAIEEWEKILSDETSNRGFYLGLAGFLIEQFAEWDAARHLIPKLAGTIGLALQNGTHANQVLAYLDSALPHLTDELDDDELDEHLGVVLAALSGDPNGPRYFVHSDFYSAALNQLLDAGQLKRAREFLAVTDSVRNAPGMGRSAILDKVAARIEALSDSDGRYTFIALLADSKDGQRVYWQVGPEYEQAPNSREPTAVWQQKALPLPKSKLPERIEIFAGTSPGDLERVARTTDVSSTKGVQVTGLAEGAGILQVRWKDRSGIDRAGPLTPYLIGTNIAQLDPEKADEEQDSLLRSAEVSEDGPVKGMRTISIEANLPIREVDLTAAEIAVEEEDAEFALMATGWFKSPLRDGSYLNVQLRARQENGDEVQRYSSSVQQSDGWIPFFAGMTTGFSMPNVSNAGSDAEALLLNFQMRPRSGYNGNYVFDSTISGLRVVRVARADLPDVSELFNEARQKSPAEAVDLYREALRMDPAETTQRYAERVLTAFEESGNLGDLYEILSNPALYLDNPLRGNRASLTSKKLIRELALRAVQPDASKAAKQWLTLLENADLDRDLSFQIEIALLLARAEELSDEELAESIAETLGYRADGPDEPQVGVIWADDESRKGVLSLLEVAERHDAEDAVLQLIQSRTVQSSYLAAQRLLEARLLARKVPEQALAKWSEAVSLRRSNNRARLDYDAFDDIVALIAETHPTPEDVLAGITLWAGTRTNDLARQKRYLVEGLYDASQAEGDLAERYRELHAREELAALQFADHRTSRDRISQLVGSLVEQKNWEDLRVLVDRSESHSAFRSSSLKEEIEGVSDLLSVAEGNLEGFWPVSWCRPGTDSKEVQVFYEWSGRGVEDFVRRYDNAIAVGGRFPVDELEQQRRVEIRFGTSPQNLASIAEIETSAVKGETSLTLPASSGYLQAVALMDDREFEGPLTPVLSGERIFPKEEQSLTRMLTEGERPLEDAVVTEAGTSPDGSPAVRIGESGENKYYHYLGPKYSVEPDKFYVVRFWLKRSGNGRADVSVVYEAGSEDGKRPLTMIVAENEFDPGRWVLYTRAVPTFDQHTFWIPNELVKTVQPKIWNAQGGTEIAGFELIEVSDWEYGAWIGEIAQLRESVDPESASSADVDVALKLARTEPLTALDYHGDWLGELAMKEGRTKELFEIYERSWKQLPNPLIAVPKQWRLMRNYASLLDQIDDQPELQWEMALAAVDEMPRGGFDRGIAHRARLLELADGVGKKEEATAVARKFLFKDDQEERKNFLERVFKPGTYSNMRPQVKVLELLSAAGDQPDLVEEFAEQLQKSDFTGHSDSERAFASLAVLACIPGRTDSDQWRSDLDAAHESAGESKDITDSLYFSHALADYFAENEVSPELLLEIRKRNFTTAMQTNDSSESRKNSARVRSGSFLIEDAVKQGNPELARETAVALAETISESDRTLSSSYLIGLGKALDALVESGLLEPRDRLIDVIRDDAEKNSSARRALDAHLNPDKAKSDQEPEE